MDQENNKKPRFFLYGLAVAVVSVCLTIIVCSLIFGKIFSDYKKNAIIIKDSSVKPEEIAKFQDIIDFVGTDFCLEYDINKLLEGAIGGFIDGLGDRFSYYITPGDYDDYEEYITGKYVGIGITYERADEGLFITDVGGGSPADEAGIRPADMIVSIGDREAKELTDDEVQDFFREEGVTVGISVMREGTKKELSVTTAVINRTSVYLTDNGDGIFTVRLTQFDDDTGDEFGQAMAKAAESGMKGLIMDLRDNGGGYERESRKVADILLGEGTIATSRGKDGVVLSTLQSDAGQVDVPVVLLVNGSTASASELVTGAFRDFKKGLIIGEKTYGKALGQVSRSYEYDGSGVVITVARYFTPSGECIHGKGISPDIEVHNDGEGDRQYDTAVAELKKIMEQK